MMDNASFYTVICSRVKQSRYTNNLELDMCYCIWFKNIWIFGSQRSSTYSVSISIHFWADHCWVLNINTAPVLNREEALWCLFLLAEFEQLTAWRDEAKMRRKKTMSARRLKTKWAEQVLLRWRHQRHRTNETILEECIAAFLSYLCPDCKIWNSFAQFLQLELESIDGAWIILWHGVFLCSEHCRFPPLKGPCRGSFPVFYYDVTTNSCESFIYGGCRGNSNNFLTREECESTCRSLPGESLIVHNVVVASLWTRV